MRACAGFLVPFRANGGQMPNVARANEPAKEFTGYQLDYAREARFPANEETMVGYKNGRVLIAEWARCCLQFILKMAG